MIMDIRKPFEFRERVQVFFDDDSLTKQQFKNDCDVNVILKKYGRHGVVPQFDYLKPQFGDFTTVEDFHSAIDRIMDSRAVFDRLPATLRARFKNDPALLLEFVADDRNYDEAVKLGICSPKVEANKTENQSSAQVPT